MSDSNHADKRSPHGTQPISLKALPIVELTEREYTIAEELAQLRDTTYDRINGGTVYGDQSRLQAHLTGAIGEIAAARYLESVSLDDVDGFHTNGDPGWDFRTPWGTVDVKTTATDRVDVPDLLVPTSPEPVADYYLLAHRINSRKVRMIGAIDRESVLAQRTAEFPSDSENYIVSADVLWLFD